MIEILIAILHNKNSILFKNGWVAQAGNIGSLPLIVGRLDIPVITGISNYRRTSPFCHGIVNIDPGERQFLSAEFCDEVLKNDTFSSGAACKGPGFPTAWRQSGSGMTRSLGGKERKGVSVSAGALVAYGIWHQWFLREPGGSIL